MAGRDAGVLSDKRGRRTRRSPGRALSFDRHGVLGQGRPQRGDGRASSTGILRNPASVSSLRIFCKPDPVAFLFLMLTPWTAAPKKNFSPCLVQHFLKLAAIFRHPDRGDGRQVCRRPSPRRRRPRIHRRPSSADDAPHRFTTRDLWGIFVQPASRRHRRLFDEQFPRHLDALSARRLATRLGADDCCLASMDFITDLDLAGAGIEPQPLIQSTLFFLNKNSMPSRVLADRFCPL